MIKKILYLLFFLSIISLSFYFVDIKNAKAVSIVDNIICAKSGNGSSCTLNDFVKLALNISQWILGISGSLTFLFMIYGGFMFLISAGNSETVTKAKGIITGAVIGLFIVFGSYVIIGFVMKATGADTEGTSWAKVGWFENEKK